MLIHGRAPCERVLRQVTLLSNELKLGNKDTMDRLLSLVCRELRLPPDRYLQAERIGQMIEPTHWPHVRSVRKAEDALRPNGAARSHATQLTPNPAEGVIVIGGGASARLISKRERNESGAK